MSDDSIVNKVTGKIVKKNQRSNYNNSNNNMYSGIILNSVF